MRSLLFAPADSPRKLERAWTSGADAIIIDLEDSVAPSAKADARNSARAFLDSARQKDAGGPLLIVRINALDSGFADADLDAVMPGAPAAIMLPKAQSGVDVQHLGAKLAVREAECNLGDGFTRILPIVTETGASLFGLGTYAGSSRRLAGLSWGADDLAADLGAEANRDATGRYTHPYELARSMMLFAAAAAGVPAIDTVFTNFRDVVALTRECADARRDGFGGKMAIHPDQIATINSAFTPDPDAVRHAQAIVAAFVAQPDAGVLAIDGRMIDRPHLRAAQQLLARISGRRQAT